jgi:hypothetical protein
MAKPPEPLQEILPKATWVVDAEVLEVLKVGPPAEKKEARAGASDIGQKNASQTVKLKINRVLKGDPINEMIVEKPEAGYLLRAGNRGPFLIDESKMILGRYGPDTYAFSRLEVALKK